jgi:hypothetical protein
VYGRDETTVELAKLSLEGGAAKTVTIYRAAAIARITASALRYPKECSRYWYGSSKKGFWYQAAP